ncbi:M23 family metallopeptidase [Flavobacteriaceae bacterium]|jgi:murein DD-endopeptidase MepM/ murein hydrolase activator NlpD|nr:M23 family metallopeptidase [Flavobacteriaceae bacterium]MDA9139820.1 M23 family metallopeptidase [Flavobacteriaceae bacterium]MDA9187813.1 M23 family metallopeptidase [Flavobacteriaceae bacterium]MDC0916735.1 M23 family metallopeptidase [Flavobacteriaceae bacterium]
MAKEEKKRRQFLQKLLNPYLVMIIDEETFEEQTQIRFSRLKMIFVGLLMIGVLGTLIFSTIAFTPLKEYIPGYDSSELRKKAVQNLFLADSLITLYNQNIQYLNSVRKVLSEDISFEESQLSVEQLENQNLAVPSFTEPILEDSLLRAFVSQQDKYNPLISDKVEINSYLFPPALGPISQPFDLKESHFAVDIVVKENTPIKAIADGTVIFSEWTAETGYVIILEHSLGILSVYKHNASLTKKQGDSVLSGEVIATAGNTGELSTGFHLHFELWMDGYPMNPENFFNFSEE